MPNDNVTNGQISMEQGPSLQAVATPVAQAETLAPMDGVQLAANTTALRPVPAATPAAESYNVVVKAPPAGGMLAYLVGPGAQIQLVGIDLNKATLAQEGGNLRITLPNGAEVLLLDYVNSARDSSTTVVTDDGKLPAQALLAALDGEKVAQKVADVEPAAGPQAGGEGGGLLVPTINGIGVGSGEGIFSSVIGPFAIPVVRDAIFTNEYPFEPGIAQSPLIPGGPVNNPPIARNDAFSTAVGVPVTMTPGQLLANDSDADGDPLTIISVQGASHGTVVLNPDGTVTFTPTPGFQGTASYSYTITDGNGGTSTADVIIQIDPDPSTQNNVIAADDTGTVVAGRAITINVLANDSDPEGDTLVPGSVRILQGPSKGTATVNPDGTITYQSVGVDPYFVTLVYEVSDDKGARDTATVTIEVIPAANNVIAVDDTGEIVPAGATKTFNVTGNDYDPQGDSFQISRIVSGPAQGRAVIDPVNGTITYESVPSNTGYTATITYEIVDARGATDTATLTIRVEPTNNVSAVDDTADLKAGQDVRIEVLKNDFDAQGDTFTITRIVDGPRVRDGNGFGPARGTVTINADGTITYTDPAGARDSAVVEFTYEITDSKGATDIAVVRVTIGTAPNGVDANNDTLTVAQDSARTNVTSTLLANDFDPQNDTFRVTAITQPSVGQGTVELVGDQVFFTPAPGFNGPVVFTYTITDSKGATDTAQVTINVQEAPNLGLNAGDDTFSTPFNTDLTMTVAQILANDYDPDGSVLSSSSIISFTQPLNGTVTRDANGNFIYNPNDTFRGTDTFTYTIRDGQGQEDTATVTIRVADPQSQDNPVDAVDDSATLRPTETKFINVLTNDSAPDGGLQFVRVVGQLPAGVTDLGNGIFSYTAPAGAGNTSVSFQYEVRDIDGDTDIATVTFNVGPNTVDARDDVRTMPADVNSILIDAKANDVDPEGDSFTITRIVSVSSGTAVIENDQIRYTNPTRAAGTATIVYEITDSKGATDTATITVNIQADFNNVIANDDVRTMPADVNSILIDAKANDVDPQGDTFNITRIVSVSSGTATIENGQIRYTNPTRTAGTATIVYEVTDEFGATDQATITVNIVADTNSVVAVDDVATMPADVNSILINAKANDFDPQNDTFNITRIVSVSSGTATIENGQIRYNNPSRTAGTATIVYEITDEFGATDQATITVNIVADTNSVVAVDDVATMPADVNNILINAKGNDFDPQGDTFNITRIVSVSSGTAVIENGQIRYTNPTRDAGTATIVYEITDEFGATDTATITVNIAADANNVIANDDIATMASNVNSILIDAKANDTDPQGDPFSITRIVSTSSGTATIENGQIRYNNPSRTAGTATIVYEVTDSKGATDTATITVNIEADINSVVAVDDTATVSRGRNNVTVDVLANDFDPQGDSFSITRIVSVDSNSPMPWLDKGTAQIITVNGQQMIRFTEGYLGLATQATVVYEITDQFGAKDTATVTITIQDDPSVPPPPTEPPVVVPPVVIPPVVIPPVVIPPVVVPPVVTPPVVVPPVVTPPVVVPPVVVPPVVTPPVVNPPVLPPRVGEGGRDDCPVTIDLNGDGIRITSLANSNARFDLNGDGVAEHTAWVSGSDDAILAIDRNGNGMIDGINEVFGKTNLDGFTELRALEDTNHDGVLDANDANWANLKLWLDANGDGVTQEGELHSLADFGIVGIDLNAPESSVQYGDAYISHTGTVTLADGSTISASSVFYTNDSNGHLSGTSRNDVLVYDRDAVSIEGHTGTDTLKVMDSGETIVLNAENTHGVESVDLANNGADHLTINVNDVLTMSDSGILTVSGDAVDQITLTGDLTQGANVTQNGHTYASYTAGNGGTVLVELGLTVTTQENQH